MDEIVFMLNDPQVIESRHLPLQINKRKPDIICVFTSLLRRLNPDCAAYEFSDWQIHLAKQKREPLETKPTWKDIHLVWELKASKELSSEPLTRRVTRNEVLQHRGYFVPKFFVWLTGVALASEAPTQSVRSATSINTPLLSTCSLHLAEDVLSHYT